MAHRVLLPGWTLVTTTSQFWAFDLLQEMSSCLYYYSLLNNPLRKNYLNIFLASHRVLGVMDNVHSRVCLYVQSCYLILRHGKVSLPVGKISYWHFLMYQVLFTFVWIFRYIQRVNYIYTCLCILYVWMHVCGSLCVCLLMLLRLQGISYCQFTYSSLTPSRISWWWCFLCTETSFKYLHAFCTKWRVEKFESEKGCVYKKYQH